jgi:putative flippase GtrA
MNLRGRDMTEILRFFSVALGGLVLDLGVASFLILRLEFSDPVAAAWGLFAGMVFNYFCHLRWTFRDHDHGASLGHFARFSLGVGATLVVRVALLEAMARLGAQAYLHPTVRLGIAAAASFILSYVISRKFIFAASRSSGEGS